ncbi:hypothetical protein SCP_0111420 [Sparassis crispa]|uniref:LCCL domain-containing protein n=1 Tax=Sparassis crispa TaxID=139825 RepID=A0A401G7Y4_9APHY|nr:hypothetical protein SCP_0111420 [Sparassis crispa]GBE78259.1 hypothetical protein SCP_0111420 [Sparassis crispa]
MAAPPEVTILDLSGKYMMNKSFSDDTDEILRLQGVGWWTRKAIQMSNLYLSCKHYKDDKDVEHIDIGQTLSGGVSGTTENRILDWVERPNEDNVFGAVKSKSKRIRVEDIENEFLKEGWLDDTKEHGAVLTIATSDTEKSGMSWVAEQSWGFQDINGERRYTRHVNFTGSNGENVQARLVYDYQGPL